MNEILYYSFLFFVEITTTKIIFTTYSYISALYKTYCIFVMSFNQTNTKQKTHYYSTLKNTIMKALINKHQTFFQTVTMLFSTYTVVLVVLMYFFSK